MNLKALPEINHSSRIIKNGYKLLTLEISHNLIQVPNPG